MKAPFLKLAFFQKEKLKDDRLYSIDKYSTIHTIYPNKNPNQISANNGNVTATPTNNVTNYITTTKIQPLSNKEKNSEFSEI